MKTCKLFFNWTSLDRWKDWALKVIFYLPPPSVSLIFDISLLLLRYLLSSPSSPLPSLPPSSSRRTVRDTHVLHGYKRFVALHLFPSLHAFPLLPCPPSCRTTGSNSVSRFSRPRAKNIFGACYLDQANIRDRSLFCVICFLICSCFNLLSMTLVFNINSTLPPCLAFVLESCRD